MTPELMSHLAFAFGLLGNILSFMVFLSPLPTFFKVYKEKSTEGFQSIPYIVGLYNALLSIYYALLKSNAMLVVSVNVVGSFINTVYICVLLTYFSKNDRIKSLKLILLMIVVGFGLIVGLTQVLAKGANRIMIVGWLCLVFALYDFVKSLGIMIQIIETKSVKNLHISQTFARTITAIIWFFYNIFHLDFKDAVPNLLEFIILYFVYE